MENILYLANTPVTNSVRRYQPISYLLHDGAQGGIVVSPDLLFVGEGMVLFFRSKKYMKDVDKDLYNEHNV